ncbi:MAG: DNA/RNA non-specific endonuclease [Prevotella sp.]|nr:DNA/RNA non-specific endonuclease [Prevotella sp.]
MKNNIHTFKYFVILATMLASITFVSCGSDDDDSTDPKKVNTNRNLQLNAQGWEVPRLQADAVFINHTLSDGTRNYCMEYVNSKYHTRWVAYRYDPKNAQQLWNKRTDAWAPDPMLDKTPQYQIDIQSFKGYNRGHLVGSAERYYSKEANEQTFYMTNMSPMIGAFNQTYWSCVEDPCRDNWGRKCTSTGDTIYVVKGGTIDQTIGTCQLKNTLGNTVQMVIPKYYFMACVKRTKSNTVTGIAFWMEHKDFGNKDKNFLNTLARQSAITIDELERRTGIDFFCNMPDELENKVEATYNEANWAGL